MVISRTLRSSRRQARRISGLPENMIEVGAELTADHFVRGSICRCDRNNHRQGLQRRNEALEFRRFARDARRLDFARSQARQVIGKIPARSSRARRWPDITGRERVTTQNLEVVRTDADRGLILIRGAVPGAKGGWVMLRDAVQGDCPKEAPKPGAFRLQHGGGGIRQRKCGKGGGEMKADVITLDAASVGSIELQRRCLRP